MRNKISCSASGCVHNMSGLCSANTINVQGESAHNSNSTQCDTFAERGFINAVTNLSNMNLTGEVKQLFNKENTQMSPDIKCDAVNCIHNMENLCGAGYVVIYGPGASSSDGTQCETFVK